MCGIFGIYQRQQINREYTGAILQEMSDVLYHRGPDDFGFYFDEKIALGHRRLAILDLSKNGAQPMQNQRYVISFNGEIYNFAQIRSELISKGYSFFSNSDTEVILQGYAHFGEKIVEMLNGMFAFVIYDKQLHEIFAARDRYGVKPFYYFFDKEKFIFASEIKAILKHPEVKTALDKQALAEYVTFQNIFSSRTLFTNISLFEKGSFMKISADFQPKTCKYWDFNFTNSIDRPSDEYILQIQKTMDEAVKSNLISDVEVASYLSSGIDSSLISAHAARASGHLYTFTMGSYLEIENSMDERHFAEKIANHIQSEHYEAVVKPKDIEKSMKSIVWHLEEPRCGQSYPNYYISKLASKFTKVVLCGAGSDEIFGGYPWRYYTQKHDNFEDYTAGYFNIWNRLLPKNDKISLFQTSKADENNAFEVFKSFFNKNPQNSDEAIANSLYFEANTFLQGLLIAEDKISMAHSIETRVPFLDNNLVDLALAIPNKYKIRQDLNQELQGKAILRDFAHQYLPNEIAALKKRGFSTPDGHWFQNECKDYVLSSLFAQNAKIHNILDKKALEIYINDHMNGVKNYRLLIWSLLYLENFLTIFDL